MSFNLDLAMNGEVYEVAAAFFYGREGLIPEMFKPLVDSLWRQVLQVSDWSFT